MPKINGVTYPSDLIDTEIASESNFFGPVYDSITGLDAALGKIEPVQASSSLVSVSSTSETNLFSYTVAANALGTNNYISFELSGTIDNNSGADRTVTFTLYYGGSSISFLGLTDATDSSPDPYRIWGVVQAAGSTGSQRMWMMGLGTTGDWSGGKGDYGTASQDSTGALTFRLTVTNGATVVTTAIYSIVTLHDVS